jgi:dihydroflavonol-4-reductase
LSINAREEWVFLTGATGFVGGHVLTALLAAGYRVRALVRDESVALPAGVERVLGDLRQPGALARQIGGCRYLVHTAALYSFAPADRPLMHAVNVLGTAGLLEAARIAGVERAVVTGSAHAARGASAYHASKLAQQRAAIAARVPAVLLLPTTPVGPGDRRPTPTGGILVDAMRGRLLAYPPGRMNLVAVEDVARAHVLALKRGRPRVPYVIGDLNLDLREVFALATKAAGRRPPTRPLPVRLALLAAWGDELRCRARLGREPAIPLEGVRMSTLDMTASSEPAEAELGWRPESGAEQAVGRAVEWFRSNGYAA